MPVLGLVLVVDDDEDSRAVVAEYLAFRGYRVATADNGLDGVSQAANLLPALVLMDLAMPVLDGWEATRRLKSDPRTRTIPVIALTAFGNEPDLAQRALEAGCHAVLTKPVAPRDLEAELRRMLASGGAPGGLKLLLRNALEAATQVQLLPTLHARATVAG